MRVFAKIINGILTEYPVYDVHIQNRKQRESEFAPVVYSVKPPEHPYFYLKEVLNIQDDCVFVTYQAIEKSEEEKSIALGLEKAKAREAVNTIRYSKIYTDVPYIFPGDEVPDGVQMRDETDRQNIQDFVSIAGMSDPATTMYFMPVSNNVKTLTVADAIDMGKALKARGDAIFGHSWTLKSAIENASTLETLQAIDLTSDWPE